MSAHSSRSLLLVANWDSGVGYAWWLMESYWLRLAELYGDTHRPLLVFPSISTISEPISQSNIECLEVDLDRSVFRSSMTIWRFVRKHGVDVVYFSDRSTWSVQYLIYKLAGVRKIVVHDHTPGRRQPAHGWRRVLKSLLNRIPWLSVDAAIGASDFVERRLVETGCVPRVKAYSVPNGIPELPDRGRKRAGVSKKDLGVPEDVVVFATVARANRYKQIDFVLRCLSAMESKSRGRLHYLFVGDGPDLNYFKEYAQKIGVDSCVTFAGRRDDVLHLLDTVDFAIHPSKGEVGYSLSILEYMRAALPVIVPDNPSVCGATIHETTGLIYEEDNLVAASEAIERLANDERLRKTLGEQAKAEVERSYRISHSHTELTNAFLKIDSKLVLRTGLV